jgi:AraC-like DNA-binding protein
MSTRTIERMIDWVEDNMEANPKLPQMADYLGYSSFYCSSKFHEYVGISFKEYVLRRRLSLSALALKEKDARILDIALQYGFSSHEAFSRAFKKQHGCSPYEYRQNNATLPIFEKIHLMKDTPLDQIKGVSSYEQVI